MIKVILIIMVIVLAAIGIGVGMQSSLNPNMNIKDVQANINGQLHILPLENGVYKSNTSNIENYVIIFDSSNIIINSLSNVHYSAYFTDLTPHYQIVGNTVVFELLAFEPFIFTLVFTLHYTVTGWFGVTAMHTQSYKISIS